jgi:predicted AlkP superfamily pyrophosphatase or phosphodiesterase
MSSRRWLFVVFLLLDLLIVGGVLYWIYHGVGEPPGPGKPEVVADPSRAIGPPKVKLAVLVVFDQMRGDYVDKWRPLFGDGGFKRLQNDGAWYSRCLYPYATTTTGPGHASILSGTSAWKHGIIENSWFDRASGKAVYCAGSERYQTVPPKPGWLVRSDDPKYSGSPERFLGETLADVLKAATAGKGKVFGVSLKDRSAIFPTGKHADGAYWFDGRFVTSTYYRDAIHPWVAAFNDEKLADSWYGKTWDRFRPDLNYVPYSGPDDGPGEARKAGLGVTFPHPLTGGKPKLERDYYDALEYSAIGNDLLLAFAKRCIVEEQLGRHDVPDFLTVSFSSNDLVGHTFGPDSQEVLDVTLRSDALMKDFLQFLDDKVGKGNYALVMTADHGVCPIPQVQQAKGIPAGRIPIADLLKVGEAALQARYGRLDGNFDTTENAKKTKWIETESVPWIYLNQRLIASRGLNPGEVAETLAAALRATPNILAAYTRGQLSRPDADLDDVGRLVKRSFHPDRAGDVGVVPKPYFLVESKSYTDGTTHGTPHEYDRHVPLLVFGPGVSGGERKEDVHPQHAAAILAHFLGLTPPANAEYGLPKTLFEE